MQAEIERKEIADRAAFGVDHFDVAVLIPCFNEAATIGKTVHAFRKAVPLARVYVFDNNSHDSTAEIAAAAGAIVRRETAQGKGNVVRRMFADIDADIYVIVDGDGTYDANAAPRLLKTLASGPYDMVNAARKHIAQEAYRPGHIFGNRVLTGLVGLFFGAKTTDLLSGYKAFSRRFVKTFPAMSTGFEIETELMIHALDLRLPFAEIEAPYDARPEGSTSKLSTLRDGLRILKLLGWLLKHEKPLLFFSSLAFLFLLSFIWSGNTHHTGVPLYRACTTFAYRCSCHSHHAERDNEFFYGTYPRHGDIQQARSEAAALSSRAGAKCPPVKQPPFIRLDAPLTPHCLT